MDDHSQPNENKLRQRIWHRVFEKSKAPRRWFLPTGPITFSDDEQWQREHDEVSLTIRRVMLAIVAYSLFCILALGAPDVILIASNASIKLPFADTEVSYSGFLIAGPLILIGLFVYLHVFVGYLERLTPPSTRVPLPFIFNMPSSFTRFLADALLYYLVPVVILVFTWKAAPRSESIWLLFSAELIGTYIIFLKIRRFAWDTPPTKFQQARYGALWLMLALLSGLVSYTPAMSLHRPLSLFKADLSGLDLRRANLKEAFLEEAKLEGANLRGANLEGANLKQAGMAGAIMLNAKLEGANLNYAFLEGAYLYEADLRGANLKDADLTRADLEGANLTRANLKDADLKGAEVNCGQLKKANNWELSYRIPELACGADIPAPPG
jgi:hypothetical protein